jgi:hypothetical protein
MTASRRPPSGSGEAIGSIVSVNVRTGVLDHISTRSLVAVHSPPRPGRVVGTSRSLGGKKDRNAVGRTRLGRPAAGSRAVDMSRPKTHNYTNELRMRVTWQNAAYRLFISLVGPHRLCQKAIGINRLLRLAGTAIGGSGSRLRLFVNPNWDVSASGQLVVRIGQIRARHLSNGF